MSRYTVDFRCCGNGYMCRMSDTDQCGGGAFVTYLAAINCEGKHMIDLNFYVVRLGSNNTRMQDEAIRRYHHWQPVLEPTQPLDESVLTGHASSVLAALRFYEAELNKAFPEKEVA